MKKLSILLCAIASLMICGCEKFTSPERSTAIPEIFSGDFYTRYPGAKVISTAKPKGDDYLEIDFIDKDGFENKAVYEVGWLSYACRYYRVDDFLFQLPRPVLGTYLSLGLQNEVFTNGDYSIFEVKRETACKKQYEFHCVASFKDGDRMVNNMMCHIAICEDGTLLTFQHGGFRYSDVTYDMGNAIDVVYDMFCQDWVDTGARILGAVEGECGDYFVFVRDNGVFKTVRLYGSGKEFWWKETRYSLPSFTVLPDYIRQLIDAGDPNYPEYKLYDVFMRERPGGNDYGVTFGTALNYSTHYIEVR